MGRMPRAKSTELKTDGSALEASIGYQARLTHRALARELERLTLPHGISSSQWPLMRVLWNEEGLTQRELSRRVAVREPTIASALHKMEKNGLIRRLTREDDRRNRRVFLAAKGRRLKETLWPCVAIINAIALAGLSADEITAARRILLVMNKSLAEEEAASERLPSRTKRKR